MHSFLGIGLVVFCLAREFIIIVSLRRFVATVVFHLQKANKYFAFFLLTVKCCDVTETIRQLTLGWDTQFKLTKLFDTLSLASTTYSGYSKYVFLGRSAVLLHCSTNQFLHSAIESFVPLTHFLHYATQKYLDFSYILFGEYILYSNNLYFDRERPHSICTNEFLHSAIEGLHFNAFFPLFKTFGLYVAICFAADIEYSDT